MSGGGKRLPAQPVELEGLAKQEDVENLKTTAEESSQELKAASKQVEKLQGAKEHLFRDGAKLKNKVLSVEEKLIKVCKDHEDKLVELKDVVSNLRGDLKTRLTEALAKVEGETKVSLNSLECDLNLINKELLQLKQNQEGLLELVGGMMARMREQEKLESRSWWDKLLTKVGVRQ